MNGIKNKVKAFVIKRKTEKITQKLHQSMQFPIRSNVVQRVLVILPRNLAMLDRASQFVQSLRNNYPAWRVELFDVDKLTADDLNRMKLPKQNILDRLRKANYHFVLDLNDNLDQVAAYITLMTEAPYRLRLRAEDTSTSYNIVYQPHTPVTQKPYGALLDYLEKLFIH